MTVVLTANDEVQRDDKRMGAEGVTVARAEDIHMRGGAAGRSVNEV